MLLIWYKFRHIKHSNTILCKHFSIKSLCAFDTCWWYNKMAYNVKSLYFTLHHLLVRHLFLKSSFHTYTPGIYIYIFLIKKCFYLNLFFKISIYIVFNFWQQSGVYFKKENRFLNFFLSFFKFLKISFFYFNFFLFWTQLMTREKSEKWRSKIYNRKMLLSRPTALWRSGC